MPELPEVEVVRRGLAPHVLGRTVTDVDVIDHRSLRRQSGGIDRLRAVMVGARISALARRGKFLWWRLADDRGEEIGEALVTHLDMSGQLRVRGAEMIPPEAPQGDLAPSSPTSEGPHPDPLRHRRITLHLDDSTRVDFVDQRLFGGLWTSDLVPTVDGLTSAWGSPDELLPHDARGIARDLLDEHLDRASVVRTLRSRRAPIKSLLLHQGIISGIGNIYADEGLWRAAVRYDAPAARISAQRLADLLESCSLVMHEALRAGGTSFDALYVNVDGHSGYFARSLNAYGKAGEPCPRCGTLIIREPFQNRSSFRCPRCQRHR